MDMESVLGAITEIVGEWRRLGLRLKIQPEHIETIHHEQHTIFDKKIAMIQKWMSGRPTWSVLVEALFDMDMRNKAKETSQQYGKIL